MDGMNVWPFLKLTIMGFGEMHELFINGVCCAWDMCLMAQKC